MPRNALAYIVFVCSLCACTSPPKTAPAPAPAATTEKPAAIETPAPPVETAKPKPAENAFDVATLPIDKIPERAIISLTLSDYDYQTIQKPDGVIHTTDALLSINGQSLHVTSLVTNEDLSRLQRRKSFSLSVNAGLKAQANGQPHTLRGFTLHALQEDDGYFRNYLAFTLLRRAGLLPVHFELILLRINNHDEGVYLLVEHPMQYATEVLGTPFLGQLNFQTGLTKDIWYHGERTPFTLDDYLAAYQEIYANLARLSGKPLAEYLQAHMNLAHYYRYLAVNYLIGNGDYVNDPYLFQDAGEAERIYFDILPWKADKTFFFPPHEGWTARNQAVPKTSLIYSAENLLDRTIAQSPELYLDYLDAFAQVLDQLTPEFVAQAIQRTYSRLAPFYQHEAAIAMSAHDTAGRKQLSDLQHQLNDTYHAYRKRWLESQELLQQQRRP
ncbi:MAG: CotH kinase family protein [Pseudomonadota bacterium]